MAKLDVTITKELQDTVKLHDGKGNGMHRLIKEVYFDENGNHYFNKHKVNLVSVDDAGFNTGSKEVECLGSKSSIVHFQNRNTAGKVIATKDVKCITEITEIYATVSREDILTAKAVSKPKSQKEQLEILKAAAEIAKGDNFEELMGKLKDLK
jgi:hypothetical protein